AEMMARLNVRRSNTAADKPSARSKQSRFGPVSSPGSKLDHASSASGGHHAGCLACDHRLGVGRRQEEMLDDLTFHDPRLHAEHRFHSKRGSPFRHRPYVAGESELRQILKEFRAHVLECGVIANVRNFIRRKAERSQILQRLVQAGKDQVVTMSRESSNKQLE